MLFAIALLLSSTPRPSHAQDPAPYTLHVYTNLIQIPTLVVTSDLKQLPPIPLKNFNISLDEGSPFHPTRVHREGDDPIDLAILLDASDDQNILIKNIGATLDTLIPSYLHPEDHVSIFALDCTLIRSFDDLPANAANLHLGVTAVLASPKLHGTKTHSACANQLHLWDAMARISVGLATRPGRRVLLAVSDGRDTASTSKEYDLSQLLSSESIALFALQDTFSFNGNFATSLSETRLSRHFAMGTDSSEDIFRELCQNNGGTTLPTSPDDLKRNLQNVITMLRNRYILEFPRANNSEPGLHNINVTIPDPTAFIAITGVIVPLPDTKLLADPTTVPTTTPSQVIFGNHRPLHTPPLELFA